MNVESIIWLIPVPPLLAFLLIILFTNRKKALSHTLAIGAALLSWAGGMYVFYLAVQEGAHHLGQEPFADWIPWLPLGDGWFEIGVLIDPLSAAVLFFVAWTVLMIFIYSVGYQNFGQPKGDHDQNGYRANVFALLRFHRFVCVWHVCFGAFR